MPRRESIEKKFWFASNEQLIIQKKRGILTQVWRGKNHLNSSAKIPHLLQITLSWLEANQKQST